MTAKLCAFGLAALLAVAAPGARAADADPVVATVNGAPIYHSDVVDAQSRLPAQYRELPMAAIFTTLLEQVIRSRLMTQEGRKQGLAADTAVKKRVASFEAVAIQQVYLERFVEAKVTEEAMRQRYVETIATLPPEEEVRARHILVKTEAEALKVLGEVNNGADFGEMAKLYSTDPGAGNGGELEFFRKGDMVEAFADAAFAMAIGEVSKVPVETEFGFHIIKVEERRQAPAPTFDELKNGIRQEIATKLLTAHIATLATAAAIERFNADGTPLAAAPAAPTEPAAPRN